MESFEQRRGKQPYEKPELTKHGSIEQVTGGDLRVSGLVEDTFAPPS
jgi:hypothetical protein